MDEKVKETLTRLITASSMSDEQKARKISQLDGLNNHEVIRLISDLIQDGAGITTQGTPVNKVPRQVLNEVIKGQYNNSFSRWLRGQLDIPYYLDYQKDLEDQADYVVEETGYKIDVYDNGKWVTKDKTKINIIEQDNEVLPISKEEVESLVQTYTPSGVFAEASKLEEEEVPGIIEDFPEEEGGSEEVPAIIEDFPEEEGTTEVGGLLGDTDIKDAVVLYDKDGNKRFVAPDRVEDLLNAQPQVYFSAEQWQEIDFGDSTPVDSDEDPIVVTDTEGGRPDDFEIDQEEQSFLDRVTAEATGTPVEETVEEEKNEAWNAIGQKGPVGESNADYEFKFNDKPGFGNNPGVSNIGDPDPDLVDDQGSSDTGQAMEISTGIEGEQQTFTDSQIWESDGNKYVVWQIPDTMMYMRYLASDTELDMLYNVRPRPGVTVPTDDMWSRSSYFGSANALDEKTITTGESPFYGFINSFDKATLGRPWLKTDDGMFKLWVEGFVEDRDITLDDWSNTDWWNNSTKEQRDWLLTSKGRAINDPDLPADAKVLLEETRYRWRELMKDAGISNVDMIKDANGTTLSEFFGDMITFGDFTDALALEQVEALSDRTSGIQVDERITNWLSGKGTVQQTKEGYAAVQTLAERWLGPAYGKLDEATLAHYASLIRNAESDEVGQFEVGEKLKAARKALFSTDMYDETLTYDDIATPWRNWSFNYLGERMNETSDSFMQILQSNSQEDAQSIATVYGLNTDNETVYDKVTNDLMEAIGADVQRGFGT